MSHTKSTSILLLSADFKPNAGGEAELAYALALALQNQGNRVTVLAPSDLPQAPEDASLAGLRSPSVCAEFPMVCSCTAKM